MCVRLTKLVSALTGAALGLGLGTAFAANDVLVQPPSIGQPQRGNIAGSLSRLVFGPADMSRGAYSLPIPIDLPGERGGMLMSPFPSYSAENGISEWGMGWQADLSIRRHRVVGDIGYDAADGFVSPWGRLVKGDDGAWYPAGLRTLVRVREVGGGWEAQTADGTLYTFAAADAVTTADGTFAWQLTRVETLLGDSTTYTWVKNDTGRAFLTEVRWGGRNDGEQYRARIDYVALPVAFPTWASGSKQNLDRRVGRVTLEARDAGAGVYVERWRHDLTHQKSPIGPAFYLTAIQKTFRGGHAEPAHVYQYDLGDQQLQQAQLAHEPDLDLYLAAAGGGGLQPDRASMTDLEQNGLTDLEHYYSLITVRQGEDGFDMEQLPARTGQEYLPCRPQPSINNKPRLLARMRPDADDPQVVVLKKEGVGTTTRLVVCDRPGFKIYEQVLSGAWEPGPNVRLADVDVDRRPDLVRFLPGGVQVMKNVGGASGYQFLPGPISTLAPNITPNATWVLDFNGDGKPDLMARTASSVMVWYGKGHGRFESQGKTFQFKRSDGTTLPSLGTYQFSHGDFNNDGLSDVLLSQGQTVLLYVNQGDHFLYTPVPGLANIAWTFGFPVVADLTGSGNPEVVLAKGSEAWTIELSKPSTGLLVAADDGKGTVVRFGYARVKPQPGIVHRYSLLDSLTIESAGRGAITYRYGYAAPVWHSAGRFLVGFGQTFKTSPSLIERVDFHHDDDIAGVIVATRGSDARTPGVEKFSRNDFEAALFHGIPWLRQAAAESGWERPDGTGTLASRVEYEAYASDVCPVRTSQALPDAVLIDESTLASPPALADAMHCLPATRRQQGLHADAALDFDMTTTIERNDVGQVTRVTQLGPAGPLVQQEVTYDGDGRPLTVGAPGRGSVQAVYDALGRLVEVVDAQGVTMRVAAYDPVSDAIRELHTERGPGGDSASYFGYDGYERLASSWNDYTGASAQMPTQALTYVWATSSAPGRIHTSLLADAQTGLRREGVDLLAADGAPLASASFADGRWIFGPLTGSDPASLTTRSFHRAPLTGGGAIALLDLASLYGGATELSLVQAAGFGHTAASQTTFQAGVTGTATGALVLGDGELVARTVENGVFTRDVVTDAAGRTVRVRDENGTEHHFRWDALGRLVEVTTPDARHTVRYDGYGRVLRVEREGLALIEYQYHPVTGLLAGKRVHDGAGQLVREEQAEHDALGRVTHIHHRRVADGAERDFWLAYDGDGADGPGTVPGQKGQLSRVIGDRLERRYLRDRAGRTTRTTTILGDGWRTISEEPSYRADGTVASMRVVVRGPGGEILLDTVRATELDGAGRPARAIVDGDPLYDLVYDDEGRVARADFASGESLVFEYDPVTGGRRGYRVEGPTVVGGVRWDLDDRGRTGAERFDRAGDENARVYAYDPAGRLIGADDEEQQADYAYTASGLPTTVTDASGSRDLTRTGNQLVVNGVTYRWDSLGRVVQKGDLQLEYGPSGQLDVARTPGREARYVYDESDKRVLKLVDGAPVMAWFGDAILTGESIIELVKVDGITVGLIENGQFTLLLTDQRGTPVLDAGGAAYLATPYGVRLQHADFAHALDYTRLGWDADLGTIRMGVRDYDPVLAQFWTPDPKFLEQADACVDSPEQCNLYGYAGGDPVNFTDPSGLDRNVPDSAKYETQSELDGWNKYVNPDEERVFSFDLGSKDEVLTNIDLEMTRDAIQKEWALWNKPEWVDPCSWYEFWCSGYYRDKQVPQKDMDEILNHLSTLNLSGGKQNLITNGGYAVRFWLVQPIRGEVQVDGTVGGTSTSQYIRGYTFTKSVAKTVGAEVGSTINVPGPGTTPAGSLSGKISASRTKTTTDAYNDSTANTGAGTQSKAATFTAHKGYLEIGIAKGDTYVWLRAIPADTRDGDMRFVVMRREPVMK